MPDWIDSLSTWQFVGGFILFASFVLLVLGRLAQRSPEDPTWEDRKKGLDGEYY